MILMALDHTGDFLDITGVSPTEPAQTTIPLFFTSLGHTFLRASFISGHRHLPPIYRHAEESQFSVRKSCLSAGQRE